MLQKSVSRNNINFMRRLCRLSQRELSILMSDITGNVIDTTTISKHEAGTRNPSEIELKAYAQVFKVPVQALYRDVCNQQELISLLMSSGESWLVEEKVAQQLIDS